MKKRIIPIFILMLVPFLIYGPLLYSAYWPVGHDYPRCFIIGHQFYDALKHGILYPRWLPNLYGGYGYPEFVFYQPVFFYIYSLMILIFQDLLSAMAAVIIIFGVTGALAVYLLILELDDRNSQYKAASLAILFSLTPAVQLNVLVRGDYTEYCAIMLTPWVFLCLYRLFKLFKEKKNILYAVGYSALAIALIPCTHPVVGLYCTPISFFIVIYAGITQLDRKRCVQYCFLILVTYFFALAISSPYWFNCLAMKKYILFERSMASGAKEHLVFPLQLVSNSWGFGGSGSNCNDNMSFQLGLPHLLLAIIGFFCSCKKRFIQACFICYIVMIIMMMPVSKWLWENIDILKYTQFPWRILSIITILQICCASGIYIKGSKVKELTVWVSIIILTVLWCPEQFLSVPDCINSKMRVKAILGDLKNIFLTFDVSSEKMPVYAQKHIPRLRGSMPLVVSLKGGRAIEMSDSTPYHIHYQLSCNKPELFIINQIYFPGWGVKLNGIRVDEKSLRSGVLKYGRMSLLINPIDKLDLEAFYEGPVYSNMTTFVACVSILMYLVVILLYIRKEQHSNAENDMMPDGECDMESCEE